MEYNEEGVNELDSPPIDGVEEDSPTSRDDDVEYESDSSADETDPISGLKEELGIEDDSEEDSNEESEEEAQDVDPSSRDPYQMPEGLGEKAQKRFQDLANRSRDLETQMTEIHEQNKAIKEIVQETGIDQNEFAQTMEVVRALKMGGAEDKQTILNYLQGLTANLSRELGVPVAGVDMLEGFDDLRQSVMNGEITNEFATELAQNRRAAQTQQAELQNQMMQEKQQAEMESVQEQALNQITSMMDYYRENDIDYAAKESMLRGSLAQFVDHHPSLWPQLFQSQYEIIGQAGSANKPTINTPAPLRTTGATGGKVNAKNPIDYMKQGLADHWGG
jgi:hypothetical protein